MKLPVKPKSDRDIIDDDNAFVCFANTTKDRDQIIKAINSHEKLVEALEEIRIVPRNFKSGMTYAKRLELMINTAEQALEAEKT